MTHPSLVDATTAEGRRAATRAAGGSPQPMQTELPNADEGTAGRPADCHCSGEAFETVPCFPCFRAGFETPNPDAGGD